VTAGGSLETALDRTCAAALLVLLLPVLTALAIAVRLTSDGPVVFRQTRVGLHGADFTLFKFRTMHTDAEQLVNRSDSPDHRKRVLVKLRDDPRTTPLGRFLRRWSLDELPQLWNVVSGDMSLVGPRPALRCEAKLYDHESVDRLTVKPGLTGLVQVCGRADLSWSEAIDLDLAYVRSRSFRLDIRILLLTSSAVLSGRGAY
jgi:lipopolysaccharide/colanic/teichoic acid biosynthesis glycosyltransferase